ncbi:MAG: DUF3046 domain-containing protein [Actinomycetales bacterium]|nr:DUF3046 domain-containing protein [Actinomycetales bacterium]
MRLSEFTSAVASRFDPRYAQAIMNDLVLPGIGSTPAQALAAGIDPQRVWDAVCLELRLPEEERYPHRQERHRPAG